MSEVVIKNAFKPVYHFWTYCRFAEADVVVMRTNGVITYKPYVDSAYVRRARPEQMFTYFYYEQPHHYTDRMHKLFNQRIGQMCYMSLFH